MWPIPSCCTHVVLRQHVRHLVRQAGRQLPVWEASPQQQEQVVHEHLHGDNYSYSYSYRPHAGYARRSRGPSGRTMQRA